MNDVEQLLRDKGVYFVPAGKDVKVRCFNPEHDDSSPSMNINRVEGMYHCVSCGYRGNIFNDYNQYRNVFNSKLSELQNTIRSLHMEASGAAMPHGVFSFFKPYRGLKADTYKKFNAFTCEEEVEHKDRIVFPIIDYSGKIRGFNGRHKLPTGVPKYRVSPAGVDLPLFPPIVDQHHSLVLVEGLFDALNLQDKGMTNAVCTFGTQRLSANSIYEKLLPYMIRGIVKIYILFDGDDAGRKAAKEVKEMIIMKTTLTVEILNLADGQDPGGLTAEEVETLKRSVD